MGVLNNRVWNKSYMLEFVNAAGVAEDAFTFSVPPESEEITLPNRVSETKTFGGSVFDSYGNDTMRIVLSGSTINEELKLIYRGLTLPPYYLSGESEILKLQSIIREWNARPQEGVLSVSDEKKIYLYDLSKMNTVQITTGVGRNYWEVYIKEFKIKRDKSRPLAYSYTLDMLGLPDTTTKSTFKALEGVTDIIEGVEKAIEVAETVSEYTQGVFDLVDDITSDIEKAKKSYEAKKDPSLLTVALATDSGIRILTGTGGNTFYNSAKDVLAVAQRINETFNGNANEGKEYTSKDTSVYTVNFATNGGGYIKGQSVEYGGKVVRPEDPVRERYEFLGWYKDKELSEVYGFSENVTGDLTLYAKWVQVKASVAFISNGGTSVSRQNVTIGECADLPENPTRDGYIFVAWCQDSTLKVEYDFSSPVIGDLTLYAKWDVGHIVFFNSNGGTEIESQTIKDGELLSYPITPKKEGYTFRGWYKDKDLTELYDFFETVTSEFTLHAKYEKTSAIVSFDSQGGSEIEDEEVLIGKKATQPENPSKEGYVFSYWAKNLDEAEAYDFSSEVTKDITLYAMWNQNSYTVDFNSDGGTEIKSQTVLSGEKVVFPGSPEKEDGVFSYWQKESGEEYVEYDFSLPVTESFTLKAKWVGE